MRGFRFRRAVEITLDRNMNDFGWQYVIPFVPLATRFVLGLYWHWLMPDALPEEAQERDLHRATILGLAGFRATLKKSTNPPSRALMEV